MNAINCPQARQRCPSPWACGEGCNFNNEVIPKQSALERAATVFWASDLPVQLVGPEPEESQGYPFAWLDRLLNEWDACNWWQKILVVCVLTVVCSLVAGVVVGHSK